MINKRSLVLVYIEMIQPKWFWTLWQAVKKGDFEKGDDEAQGDFSWEGELISLGFS